MLYLAEHMTKRIINVKKYSKYLSKRPKPVENGILHRQKDT